MKGSGQVVDRIVDAAWHKATCAKHDDRVQVRAVRPGYSSRDAGHNVVVKVEGDDSVHVNVIYKGVGIPQ